MFWRFRVSNDIVRASCRDSRMVIDEDNVEDVELKIISKEVIFVTERKAGM